MDTTSVTHTTYSSVGHEIWSSLVPMLWVLLFAGWFLYWMKVANAARKAAGKTGNVQNPYMRTFWDDNLFEIPSSFIACFIIAVTTDLPLSVQNTITARLAILGMGFGSSSFINSIITMAKK